MDANEIAEELYRSFKSQVLWKEVDFKRIRKFEKIIKKRFAIVLKETIDKHTTTELLDNIESEKIESNASIIDDIVDGTTNNEELIIIEPQTLLQRIVTDQDNQFVQNVLEDAIEENKINDDKIVIETPERTAEILTEYTENAIKKRYKIDIICDSIIKKPNFQIFKGKNIIDTDFRNNTVTRTRMLFIGYVDAENRNSIMDALKECFVNPQLSVMLEVPNDEIPPIYQQIWQNRTKL